LSENAKEEEPPRDDETFDYLAKPEKFYFDIETDGKVAPREVVLKVRSLLLDCPGRYSRQRPGFDRTSN
jgi:DNA-directed RNA polymerase II subunit RPB3